MIIQQKSMKLNFQFSSFKFRLTKVHYNRSVDFVLVFFDFTLNYKFYVRKSQRIIDAIFQLFFFNFLGSVFCSQMWKLSRYFKIIVKYPFFLKILSECLNREFRTQFMLICGYLRQMKLFYFRGFFPIFTI